MRDAHAWLSQGDLFRALPIVETSIQDGIVSTKLVHGPSLLCTHDCELDKRTRAGVSTVKRIQFLPLRSTSALDNSQHGDLQTWQGKLNPARIFHVGNLENLGDVFCDLAEVYALPSEYFAPALREFGNPDATELMLVATANDTRIGQVDEVQLLLLKKKLMTFMTRFAIEE